eukprot:Colp12_sorted_trinity150504_noHs@1901
MELKKIVRPQTVEDFRDGFLIFVKGITAAVTNPQIVGIHKKKIGKLLLIALIGYVILHLALLPIRLSLFIVSFFKELPENISHAAVDGWVQALMMALPSAGLLFIRYFDTNTLDALFFEGLMLNEGNSGKELNEILAKTKPTSLSTRLKDAAKRLLKFFGLGVLVLLVTSLPFVGKIALGAIEYYALQRTLGFRVAIIVGTLSLLSPLQPLCKSLLRMVLTSRALGRELLEPYLSRLYQADKKAARRFVREVDSKLLGFSLPFSLLLQISGFGPLFFGLAQAASACVVANEFGVAAFSESTVTTVEKEKGAVKQKAAAQSDISASTSE